MADYSLTLNFTLQAPVLTQTTGALGFGFDMAMLRDGSDLVLPGSLIRGNLREALAHFVQVLSDQNQSTKAQELAGDIQDWFGPKTDETSGEPLELNRARLHFDYYWRCPAPVGPQTPRHRIRLDSNTGTVTPGALIVIEAGSSGAELVFTGKITAHFKNRQQAERAQRWLEKSALFLPALGSLKGVGFGKVLKVAELKLKPLTYTKLKYDGDDRRIGLQLSLDRPFCIAKPRSADANNFIGEPAIPGGVLKGALLQSLAPEQREKLGGHIDRLVFTHALPAKEPGRARVLPLSLAWVDDALDQDKRPVVGHLVDLAFLATGCVRKTDQGLRAPKFQIDWKEDEFEAACQLVETLPSCNRHLAVHTAMNTETGQSAEKALFSLDCVDPKYEDEKNQSQTMAWCAAIDLQAIADEDRRSVVNTLQEVLARPISGIGKTKAVAAVEWQSGGWLDDTIRPAIVEGFQVISLQTPALLFHDVDVQALQASGGEAGLEKLYQDYWDNCSDGKLKLVRYFAAQQRMGGQFLWHHYQKKQQYTPFWLTIPGSVFVLEVVQAGPALDVLLDDWRRRGLPLPVVEDSSGLWEENPYIRENGYGEIRINDEPHQTFKLKPEEWS